MPRWFWIGLAAALAVAGASLALSMPDPTGTVLARVTEGGMWTGLAVFVAAAAVLGWRSRP